MRALYRMFAAIRGPASVCSSNDVRQISVGGIDQNNPLHVVGGADTLRFSRGGDSDCGVGSDAVDNPLPSRVEENNKSNSLQVVAPGSEAESERLHFGVANSNLPNGRDDSVAASQWQSIGPADSVAGSQWPTRRGKEDSAAASEWHTQRCCGDSAAASEWPAQREREDSLAESKWTRNALSIVGSTPGRTGRSPDSWYDDNKFGWSPRSEWTDGNVGLSSTYDGSPARTGRSAGAASSYFATTPGRGDHRARDSLDLLNDSFGVDGNDVLDPTG